MRKIAGLTLIVIGLVIAVGSFGSIHFSNKSVMSNNKIDKINLANYEEVILKTEVCDLEISPTEEPFMELGVNLDESIYNINTIEEGKTLTIEVETREKMNLFNFSGKNITFSLPKEFDNSLMIKQKAGDIMFTEPLDLHTLMVSNKAGDVNHISGNFEYLQIDSAAGDIYGYQVNSTETKIKGYAGDITLDQFSGSLNGSTSAGDLKVEFVTENGNVDWKSQAGDIELTIPDPNFVLETSSKLGKVEIDFPVTNVNEGSIVGNGDKIVKLSVAAGDIKID